MVLSHHRDELSPAWTYRTYGRAAMAAATRQSVSASSSKSVICKPAGASSLELSERQGVSFGEAISSAPAATNWSVARFASVTSKATRILRLTSRPISSWSISRRCAFFYGLTVWAVGVVWVLLSLAGILTPARAGLVAGSVGALVGAQIAALDAYRGWGLALAVITVTLVLVGGARRNDLGLLIVGAMGALVFSVQVAAELFGTELAAAVALLLAGALLVVGAVAASRRRSSQAST